MAKYWLDSNTFIEPKNRYYSFAIAPGYWEFLEEQGAAGMVSASTMVYDELVKDANDDLAHWVKAHKGTGLFVVPDAQVQGRLQQVAAHVQANYQSQRLAEFLGGADPWIIAHAMNDGGRVVTFETRAPGALKIKIPNICEELGVEYANLFDVLRTLGMTLNRS